MHLKCCILKPPRSWGSSGSLAAVRSLPVTINWDRLDSRWIETLLSEGEEAVPEATMLEAGQNLLELMFNSIIHLFFSTFY